MFVNYNTLPKKTFLNVDIYIRIYINRLTCELAVKRGA